MNLTIVLNSPDKCKLYYSNLWGLIDGRDNSLDAEWDVLVWLVFAVEEAEPLAARVAPVVQETFHHKAVLKLDIVNVTVFLETATISLYDGHFCRQQYFLYNG